MSKKRDEHWSKWTLFNFRMPTAMKARIEIMALRRGEPQSEIVRLSIDDFLQKHAASDGEKNAAEISSRQRRERINLMQPKDGYKTAMQLLGAWQTIKKERKAFEELGIINAKDFDAWVRRLEENRDAIVTENPEYERMAEKFNMLIVQLRKEQRAYQDKGAVK